MCGIAGAVGDVRAVEAVMSMLHSLEYRGYDSAGIGYPEGDTVRVHKCVGPVSELDRRIDGENSPTCVGHTRWATHGPVTATNAHPHRSSSGRVAVVHNGMIENIAQLREAVRQAGIEPVSETDSECLAHLIEARLDQGDDLRAAVEKTASQIEGAYAVLVLDARRPDHLVVSAKHSPLLVGRSKEGRFVASDLAALTDWCDAYEVLADGETLEVSPAYEPAHGSWRTITTLSSDYTTHGYPDFMSKEIWQQVETTSGFIDMYFQGLHWLPEHKLQACAKVSRVKFLGCGSAYYAGQQSAFLVESIARIPADAEPALDFVERNPVLDHTCLYVIISQSGETLDTLKAARYLRARGETTIAVVNVPESSLARESEHVIHLGCGPEVSVASTKVVTNMVLSGLLMAYTLKQVTTADTEVADAWMPASIVELPWAVEQCLALSGEIRDLAAVCSEYRSMYFLGRERYWAPAREGAQKLKEITYIHAEAYQSTELKHGPLSLVSEDHLSVLLVGPGQYDAGAATLELLRSRGGRTIAVLQGHSEDLAADHVLRIPSLDPSVDGLLAGVALQLLAYHCAGILGRDVDRPRNLAKSVTV